MESSGLKAQSEARDRRRSMVALSVNRSPSAQTHRSSPKATQPVKAGDPSGSRIRQRSPQKLGWGWLGGGVVCKQVAERAAPPFQPKGDATGEGRRSVGEPDPAAFAEEVAVEVH